MPKRAFFPAALVVFGLIEIASMMGFLPAMFRDFWPVIMIVVGLGGLLVSDRDEWMSDKNLKRPASRSTSAKKASRR